MHKIINIALIYMLLLGGGLAYSSDISCLRAPFIDTEREEEAIKIFGEMRFRMLIALRSMRHGGTIYDMSDTLNGALSPLDYIKNRLRSPLSTKFKKLYSDIESQNKDIKELLNKIPGDMFAELEESKIIGWQNQLNDILNKLREIEREYDEAEKQIPYTELDISYKDSVIQYASWIQKNIRKAIVILEDRIDFINNKVKKQNTDLNKIIGDICHRFSGASFKVNFKGAVLPKILTNPMMMESAITNIFFNNIKIKDLNNMSVVIRLSPNEKEIIIEISDNGPGFPEEGLEIVPGKHYQKAFEFGWSYRPKNSTLDDSGIHGGFGLAETRVYLEEDGGSIRVDSAKGEGITFTITLPVAPEGPEIVLRQALIEVNTFIEKLKLFTNKNPIDVTVDDVNAMLEEQIRIKQTIELLKEKKGMPLEIVLLIGNIRNLETYLEGLKKDIEAINKTEADIGKLGSTDIFKGDLGALDTSADEQRILDAVKKLPRKERKEIERRIVEMKQQAAMELSLAVQPQIELHRQQVLAKKREGVEAFFGYINRVVSEMERSVGTLQNWQPVPIDQIIKSAGRNRNQS